MAIIAGLRTYLLGQGTVTAIVGAAGVYPENAPQTAVFPYVILTRLDEDPNETLDGAPAGNMFTADIDIDCKATNPADAEALAEIVRGLLRNYKGALGAHTCQAIEMTDRSDGEDYNPAGTDIQNYKTTLDMTIFYR